MKILRPEFFLDLAWLVFSGAYVAVASQYPPEGRLVPMTIGLAAVAVGLLHFSGNFIRSLRPHTHGSVEEEAGALATSGGESRRDTERDDAQRAENRRARPDYLAAIGWALGLVIGIELIGAIWAMPVFFISYFGVRGRRWALGVISGALMALVVWGLFGALMNLQLPSGLITTRLMGLF